MGEAMGKGGVGGVGSVGEGKGSKVMGQGWHG